MITAHSSFTAQATAQPTLVNRLTDRPKYHRMEQYPYPIMLPFLVAMVTMTVSHNDGLASTTLNIGTHFLPPQFAVFA